MSSNRGTGAGLPSAIASLINTITEPIGNPRSLPAVLVSVVAIFSAILSFGFGPPTLTESDTAKLRVNSYQLRQLIPPPPPKLTAKSAIIMDFDTGRVLYEKNAHARVAPASTTKMMTAIVALEQGRLTDKVNIEWKHLVGYTSMGLRVGDVVSIEDLMWGMMLPSANEAAEAIGDYIGGGSVDNFVKMMNDKAAELGLRDTHYMNPHGLDEDGHYSSAYDLAVIARKALQYPILNKMAATTEITVYDGRPFQLVNSNTLLNMQDIVPGVDGFKTGYTGDAGNCLVATTTRNGHRIITVVMGADSRNPDSIELINYAFDNLVWAPLPTPAGAKFLDDTGNGRSLEISGKRDMLIRPWEKWWIGLSLNLNKPSSPFGPATLAGNATYFIGGSKVAEYPLRVKE